MPYNQERLQRLIHKDRFKALRLSTKRYHLHLVPPIAIRCEIVLEASALDAVDMELFPFYEKL
jgi:hypothetical protein